MITKTILYIIIGYAVYGAIFFFFQRSMMFPGKNYPPPAVIPGILDNYETIWLKFDKYQVETWFIPPRNNSAGTPYPVMIIAHGNASLIDYWPQDIEGVLDRGIGVLLIEYPGYGRSGGSPSQASIRSAFIKGYDLITQRDDVDSSRIILFGRSLGGGVVCDLAGHRPSRGIILLSSFAATARYAKNYLLPGFLARDPFNSIAILQNYTNPVMVIHAKDDRTVPCEHGLELYNAAQKGSLITLENGGHNHCITDWSDFWNRMDPFLEQLGISNEKGL